MRMRTLAVWLGILWGALAFGGSAWATAQIPDELVYEGEKCMLFSEPLESYWGPGNPRPRFVPPHTANWRGYRASWEIAEGMLYLTGLRGQVGNPDGTLSQVTLAEIFPGNTGRVEAVWFTGTLRVPQGKQIRYTHMGYESMYERDLLIRLERGKVLSTSVIDNTTRGGGAPRPPRPEPPK
jgi:hypothetical protein